MLLLVVSFFIIKPFLLAIFSGALLAYLFYPFYRFLSPRVRSPVVASVVVCVFVLLLILVPGIFLVKTIVEQAYVIFVLVKQRLAEGLFVSCQNSFCQALENLANDPTVSYQVQEISREVTHWVIQKGSALLVSVPRIVINLFIVFFVMFYFLKDGEKLHERLHTYLRLKKSKYATFVGRIKEIIHGIVFGYFIVALVQGAVGAIGFFLFGVSSPLFWGVIMGLLALIPYVGTGFVWLPAALFIFVDGLSQDSTSLMVKGAGLFVYGAVLISGIDNIIRPKLMGEKAKVHPAIILLGIFGGILIFGPLGIIIGPVVLALTSEIVTTYWKK
ncbi:MAG: AI-2E family transporter [Nanoarchaeota archaeon]